MRHRRGYTLLELLLAVAIATAVLGIGVPGLQRVVAHNDRVATANALIGAVQYARVEANTRAVPVVLCPSPDGERCDPAGTAWHERWLVFADYTPSRPPRIEHGDEVLLLRRPQTRTEVLANRPAFVFRPHYRRSSNGTFRLCPRGARAAPVAVIVSYTGRPRLSRRLPSGASIDCPDAT